MLRTFVNTLTAQLAELAELDRYIDDAIKRSRVWRAADSLLTSVPGIGNITGTP
jgi:transposase